MTIQKSSERRSSSALTLLFLQLVHLTHPSFCRPSSPVLFPSLPATRAVVVPVGAKTRTSGMYPPSKQPKPESYRGWKHVQDGKPGATGMMSPSIVLISSHFLSSVSNSSFISSSLGFFSATPAVEPEPSGHSILQQFPCS